MAAADCQACQAAETIKHCPYYRARCQGCQVRALATGLLFFASKQAGQMTPAYQQALRNVYGDGWRRGHDAVKAEAKRIAAMRN